MSTTTQSRLPRRPGLTARLGLLGPGRHRAHRRRTWIGAPPAGKQVFRPLFSRTIIAASGLTARSGTARIDNGDADLAAYGKLYISNPDLPEWFKAGAELTEPDRDTFYFGGAEATPTTRRSIAPSPHGRPDRGAWR
jgi:hypothetical protein